MTMSWVCDTNVDVDVGEGIMIVLGESEVAVACPVVDTVTFTIPKSIPGSVTAFLGSGKLVT